jgi:hypothetical protein
MGYLAGQQREIRVVRYAFHPAQPERRSGHLKAGAAAAKPIDSRSKTIGGPK